MSVHIQLDSELIKHVRAGQPLEVNPESTIRSAMDQMRAVRNGGVLVTDEHGKLLGIFTERDALKIVAKGHDLDLAIETVMTNNPKTLKDADTVADAIDLMASGGYRQLPILDDDNCVVGMLTVKHVLRYVVEHVPEIVYNLPPKPHHTTQNREGA